MAVYCYKCQEELLDLTAGRRIGRDEDCPNCQTSLRCCKMCQFFDMNSYNECREPVAQRIIEKEKANFCDYFKLTEGQSTVDNREQLLAAADKLFKF